MKLLLCKSIEKLGIVGDVVEVSAGYARNFLLPQHLATEPTKANMRSLAEARRVAELERERARTELEALAERIEGAEVTIKAKANETGVLYGSVGTREIADALAEEDFHVRPEQIMLSHALRELDNTEVEIRLADDLHANIKVWIIRDKTDDDEDYDDDADDREPASDAGGEAGTHGDGTGE